MAQAIDCASTITQTVAGNLKSQGIDYVGRYLGTGWKCMQKAEADIIKAAGLQIISIWETAPTSVSYFSNAKGQSDAASAVSFAKAVGQPSGSTIYFAVDYDAPSTDFAVIGDYFKGVQANIGTDYKVGAYGHYGVVEYLKSNAIVDFFFQTYAWSSGKEASDFIHIYQYQNDVAMAGIQVDHDQILKDPGAWGQDAPQPAPAPAPTPAPTPQPAPAPQPAPIVVPDTYIVQPGDSLSEICAKYGLNMTTIESLNHITNPNLIQIGQVLHFKSPAPAPQPPAVTTYVIKPGDNLTTLAIKFNTTVSVLENLNGINNPNLIYAGQTIKVPNHASPTPSVPSTYTVQSGDNLSSIAAKFNTTVASLKSLNRISNENLIYPGQVIKLR